MPIHSVIIVTIAMSELIKYCLHKSRGDWLAGAVVVLTVSDLYWM